MLWVRLSLVSLLIVVVAAVWIGRGGGPGEPVATKYGATSQGRQFELRVDAEGVPVAFATSLSALCPSGRMVEMPWMPVDGDGVRFERRGDRLHLAEHGDGWRQELDAKVAGGRVTGTMTLVVHVRPKTRAPFDCRSPKVRFSVGR